MRHRRLTSCLILVAAFAAPLTLPGVAEASTSYRLHRHSRLHVSPVNTTSVATAPTTTTTTTSTVTTPTATTSTSAPTSVASVVPSGGSALAGRRLFVEATSAARRAADLVRTSDPARALGLDYIADQSTGTWFGDWNSTSTLQAEVARRSQAVADANAVPVYVLYNIMKRDGSGYSAGGASSLTAYEAWIDAFAAGLGARRAVVVVEPDAVNDLYNMTGDARTERVVALRYALTALRATGAVSYLDAGGPSIHSATIAATLLREAGVALADGFSVNVSNFQTTSSNQAWGTAVSDLVGGKHFVVDTGRNGNGSLTADQDAQYWCNPPGRALGHAPVLGTGVALVDAYLWVKQPGESDGTCRGFASAGTFSADYAYGLYAAMPR